MGFIGKNNFNVPVQKKPETAEEQDKFAEGC